MGYQTFDRPGSSRRENTYFVADSTPGAILDDKNNVIGHFPGSGHLVTVTTEAKFSPVSGFRSSSSTPGFNSPRRPLLLKANGFSFYKQESEASGALTIRCNPTTVYDGPGSGSYEYSSTKTVNLFQYSFVSDPSSGWASGLRDKAVSRLLKNLRDSSFNAAQALAERGQTANLVASTATRVASSLRSLRRGDFSKAARDLGVIPKKRARRRFNSQYLVDQGKAIGNAWLELQYGWKPLLSDVYGSMETLAKVNSGGNPNTVYKKVSGFARRYSEEHEITNHALGSNRGVNRTDHFGSFSVSVRFGVTFAVSSPPLASLKSVGITNPLLLAWELLPYSFVVDWFLPIGNYLESLDATAGLTFVDGYVTTFTRRQFKNLTVQAYASPSGYRVVNGTTVESRRDVRCVREVLSTFPKVPMPRFKNPLSTSHVASAMALLLQLKR